jgi:ATPase subunit of ABC transporter with duplicated ATPase domains
LSTGELGTKCRSVLVEQELLNVSLLTGHSQCLQVEYPAFKLSLTGNDPATHYYFFRLFTIFVHYFSLLHSLRESFTLISTANITMQFGAKPLFENISVKFGNGNRYGLIGANGCGKSTFMKIISDELAPSAGSVSIDAFERVGKLHQDQFAFEQYNVVDTVVMGHQEMWKVKSERDRIYSLPEMSEDDGMKVADLETEFAEMDGYTAESRAGELLLGVGIDLSLHYGPMSAVAPGWKLRVLLAQALFSNPDILLLDEPTNNLDIDTIRWLETVLNERKSTMVIISHDRHFLNSVCTHMADLDYGELKVFPGNYDEYMIAATQVRERTQSDNAKKKAQIAELQSFVSRFSANASKAKQATSRAKQIDKIKVEEMKPSSRISPFIRFNQHKKLYRNAVEVKGLNKSFDDEPVLKNVNLLAEVGERIAIIGQNGVGKTTLLRILLGDLTRDSGEVKWSENTDFGYYAQDHSTDFEADMTLFDWMSQWKQENDDEQSVRGVLGRLLFSQNDINKSVKVISGGEQGRMLFGKLMMTNPNVLLMDEPTNHLDMESIESLNLALDNYPGTLFFVSHDREFVSSLATRILEVSKTGIVDFKGGYDEYLKTKDV